MRVLLAEDDETLGSGIKAGLAQHGFQVDWVRDGVAAEREILAQMHEVIILDMGLPRQDGMQTLKNARLHKVKTPVLILTAQDAVASRIEGLDAGADDYLVKPVDLLELGARLRALVRRSHGETQSILTVNGLCLNSTTRTVTLQDNAVEELYRIEPAVRDKHLKGDPYILEDWRKLTTSDHLYYMCTKYWSDGDVHKYFSPYDSPYDAYINFMNVLDNLRTRAGA